MAPVVVRLIGGGLSSWSATALLGPRFALGQLCSALVLALQTAFAFYIALLGTHRIVRARLVAVGLFALILPLAGLLVGAPHSEVVATFAVTSGAAFIMLRFGLLALAFTTTTAAISMTFPITLNLGEWYGTTGLAGAAIITAMSIGGARLATEPSRAPVAANRTSGAGD